MIRRLAPLVAIAVAALCLGTSAQAEAPCELTPRTACFGVESVDASLSTDQAGAHPDLSFSFDVSKDPESKPNIFGLKDSYATTRVVRFELPPGLIGDPNVLGVPQQCTVEELVSWNQPGGGCPNGSQVGLTKIYAYDLSATFTEPVYMMAPPEGEVIARLGFVAGIFATFVDFKVRSEGDYGLTAQITDASAEARLIRADTTTWGVPADASHDTERCTALEAFNGCVTSVKRPPGSRPLPFMTNPTRCGVPVFLSVNASSWVDPELNPDKEMVAPFPPITGCNKLPYGPSLTVSPTNRRTSSPTGLDLTIKLPKSDGVNVLEPSQTRDIRIDLPKGITVNPGSADGLGTCSVEQVHFKEGVASDCPDAAKMAATEFEIGGLPRRMKGAIYLREPEPGNLFRIWVVADDLGAHVKLPGQLEVDKQTGQIKSVVLDNPQVPLREVKLLFKSGFRAPLMTPSTCGTYNTHYEFTSWAGGPPAIGDVPMSISEGCDTGAFSPKLSAGSTDASGGSFSPFTFTITREDSEQNLSGLDVTLPKGMAASFAGIPRCEGAEAISGHCPAASRIGKTTVADGVGPNPLWVPQPGKDPTAVYLGGPYKGAPLSIVAVVPAQAGPFDLGLEVVRSAVFVDPKSAQATAKTDPLPQIIEGIPILYKAVNVILDRPHFSLNPTSCAQKQTQATLTSTQGKVATPSSSYAASNCARLAFKPNLAIKLFGGTRRSAHPKLKATVKMPQGGANIAATSVALPHSEFLDQAHIKTICTRVQFAAKQCPAGSIYGTAKAKTPLFDFPLEGPVYLRSSSNPLPDLVMALKGPAQMPIEIELAGRVDSVNGGLRTTFDTVPDAPVSEFTLEMQGGKKGLIVNSTNLCAKTNRATAKFTGQNGKATTLHPALKASCGAKVKKGKKRPAPE
jgi:hypothetical protein